MNQDTQQFTPYHHVTKLQRNYRKSSYLQSIWTALVSLALPTENWRFDLGDFHYLFSLLGNKTKGMSFRQGKFNRKKMEVLDGSPHFFKIMIGDFTRRLCIPPAFAQKIRSEIGKGENGILQGPRGIRWNVKLCSTSTRIEFFGGGWENFVNKHAIEYGDFLVFKYIHGMYFRVQIFGKTGCEKEIPIIHSEKIHNDCESHRKCSNLSNAKTSTDHLMSRKFSFDLKRKLTADVKHEVKKTKISSLSQRSESPEHFSPSLTEKECQIVESGKRRTYKRVQGYYVSSRRPVKETEKEIVLEAAKSFVSRNPFRLVIMRPSMVYTSFIIIMSNPFIDSLKLARKRTEVTLVDPNKREWPVQFLGHLRKPSLSGGWRGFSLGNNLEEGDVCILERVDDGKSRIKFDVHIFRVVKDCSPYKYVEGGREYDGLASTTQICEKGKCVKQGIKQLQGEREKPNNGIKCINLDKPKYKPFISERKASYRRSLRLAQACRLAKCPKKDVWAENNVVILS